jgi:hypothetical protein
MVSGCGGVPFSRQRRQPPHVDRTVSGLTPWLGLDSSFGQQFGVQGVADAAVDLLNVTLTDVRDDVVGGIVASVLNHRWLDRVLDAGQPLFQGVGDLYFPLGLETTEITRS